MRKLMLTSLFLIAFALCAFGAANENTYLKLLLEKIESLEQRIVELEKLIEELLQMLKTREQADHHETKEVVSRFVKATVVSVIDGDTFEVLYQGRTHRLRLIGVNAPEIRGSDGLVEPFALEAAEFAKNYLEGRTVYLEFDVQLHDTYNRLLTYIWLDLPDEITDEQIRLKMFNAILLLEGLVQVMTVPPNVKYVELFLNYQSEARKEAKGLWTSIENSDDYETIVYISEGGNRYHKQDCRYVLDGKIPVSLAEAKKMGLRSCQVCKPPD